MGKPRSPTSSVGMLNAGLRKPTSECPDFFEGCGEPHDDLEFPKLPVKSAEEEGGSAGSYPFLPGGHAHGNNHATHGHTPSNFLSTGSINSLSPAHLHARLQPAHWSSTGTSTSAAQNTHTPTMPVAATPIGSPVPLPHIEASRRPPLFEDTDRPVNTGHLNSVVHELRSLQDQVLAQFVQRLQTSESLILEKMVSIPSIRTSSLRATEAHLSTGRTRGFSAQETQAELAVPVDENESTYTPPGTKPAQGGRKKFYLVAKRTTTDTGPSGDKAEEHDNHQPMVKAETFAKNKNSTVTTSKLDLEMEDRRLRSRAKLSSLMSSSSSHKKEAPQKSLLACMVDHPGFETFAALIIFSNSIFIGVQTQAAAKSSDFEPPGSYFYIGLVYTFLFTLELVLRISSRGLASFCRDRANRTWNLFDSIIVGLSLLECLLDIGSRIQTGHDFALQGSSQLRALRILRATRLVRGIRITRVVRFVRALRTLVHQITSTVKSLLWALILLGMIMYVFAVIFTQAATNRKRDIYIGESLEPLDPFLDTYWSTVPRSAYSLFLAITGGISWIEVSDPLASVDSAWVALFVAYVIFVQLAVLNVITGVFCQQAVDSAMHDQELCTQAILAEKQWYCERIQNIFEHLDEDGSGTITIEEFESHLESEEMKALFASIGLDASDVWTLFKLLDIDGGSMLELEEFIAGCLRLKGNATSVDLAKLSYEHKFFSQKMLRFIMKADDKLRALATAQNRQAEALIDVMTSAAGGSSYCG